MTEEDYKTLSNYLEAGIISVGVEAIKEHRALKLGKDIERRFAWDLWHLAKRTDKTALKWMCGLYSYMNDEHFTTALKHFVRNYPAISI